MEFWELRFPLTHQTYNTTSVHLINSTVIIQHTDHLLLNSVTYALWIQHKIINQFQYLHSWCCCNSSHGAPRWSFWGFVFHFLWHINTISSSKVLYSDDAHGCSGETFQKMFDPNRIIFKKFMITYINVWSHNNYFLWGLGWGYRGFQSFCLSLTVFCQTEHRHLGGGGHFGGFRTPNFFGLWLRQLICKYKIF